MRLTAALYTLPFMVFGQTAETPKFVAADVHVSTNPQRGMRPPSPRGERYEVKNATMADLIALAYGFNSTLILGGPSWLEMDRYDVIAKQPPQTAPDVQKLMLRSLLAERFKLVVKEDKKPMPSYALTVGKKPQLKEADGSGDTGCQPQSTGSGPPGEGTVRLMMPGANGQPSELTLVNGMVGYKCRNMTMAMFAAGMRSMLGANVGVNPVLDQTGLMGKWNFDLKYSVGLVGPAGPIGERITVQEAIEKQLGLKLEQRDIPTAVLVVENVNQKPVANPPGTAEAFPATDTPKEFEVATIKPGNPDVRFSRFGMQAGGRLNVENMPLRFLIARAFNAPTNDHLVGVPSFADTTKFDIIAKASGDAAGLQTGIDPEVLAPMMLSLLKDRFKLTYHTEERELPAYALMAAKPKMTKADPSARAWCKAPQQIPGSPPAPSGQQALVCQNVTMAQFAEQLRGRVPGLEQAIVDSTGIEGGWDFRLTFNPILSMNLAAGVRAPGPPPEGGQAGVAAAATLDPTNGYSLFDAIEKQLGLKLLKQKRTSTVYVVDHVEQTPTDN